MWFKKSSIKKTPPSIINTIGIIGIFTIFIIWFIFIQNLKLINLTPYKENTIEIGINTPIKKTIENLIKPINISNKEKQKIKNFALRQKNNKINILVVWRWWNGHEAPNLTDTIILASINTKEKTISMLSIPRDLYVEYNNGKSGKINSIYEINTIKNNSKEIGMVAIADKVAELTGEKVNFFVNIDFNGFKKVIDVIWGIELTIDKQFVDYQYPDWNWGYKTIVFKKWAWLFDGESALKYARSRHSTSDFDRSLRQQQIINAIKDKLSTSYFLKSPKKIKELYDVFEKYVYTNLQLQDILKLAIQIKSSQYEIQSFNLNDSCFYGSLECEKWWILYVPNREFFWWASVLLVEETDKFNLSKYKIIHKYTDLIFNHPKLFKENYKINVFNSLKISFLASILADEIKKYWFYIPKYNNIWNTKKVYEKSIIYYNNINENSETIKALKKFFPEIGFQKINGPKYSKELDTKIEIIIWKDYLKIFSSYKKIFNIK
jgi:LCP family protein required for cell wall assembly